MRTKQVAQHVMTTTTPRPAESRGVADSKGFQLRSRWPEWASPTRASPASPSAAEYAVKGRLFFHQTRRRKIPLM